MKHFISADDLRSFDAGFESCRANRLAMRAVTENGMKELTPDDAQRLDFSPDRKVEEKAPPSISIRNCPRRTTIAPWRANGSATTRRRRAI